MYGVTILARPNFWRHFLTRLPYEQTPNPTLEQVTAERDLCRDESDVPVALAAIGAGADYLVTTDRDLTVVDDTTADLRQRLKIITPLALPRHVLKWPEERIDAAIHRHWADLSPKEWSELSPVNCG